MPKLKVQVWIYRTTPAGELEVLLLLLKPKRGGYWQPVTGGVDEGESLVAAALREAQEETGLDFVQVPKSLHYQFKFHSPRHGEDCEEHVFALAAPQGGEPLGSAKVKLDPHEHVDSRWVAASQAAAMLKHASNVEGLSCLVKNLNVQK